MADLLVLVAPSVSVGLVGVFGGGPLSVVVIPFLWGTLWLCGRARVTELESPQLLIQTQFPAV